MIKIGWIDFSNDDREKAMAVIDMMKDKGAVDELGIIGNDTEAVAEFLLDIFKSEILEVDYIRYLTLS